MLPDDKFNDPSDYKEPCDYQRTPGRMFLLDEQEIQSKVYDNRSDEDEHDYLKSLASEPCLNLNFGDIIPFAFTCQKVLAERAFLKISTYIYFAVWTHFHTSKTFIV